MCMHLCKYLIMELNQKLTKRFLKRSLLQGIQTSNKHLHKIWVGGEEGRMFYYQKLTLVTILHNRS